MQDANEEIARELNLDRLLGLIIQRTVDLVGADHGIAFLWDNADGYLRPTAWVGLGPWVATVRLRLGEGIAGAVAQTRRGMIVDDYRSSAYTEPTFLEQATYKAVLGQPLLYRDKLIGSLVFSRERDREPFHEHDLTLLATAAAQVAIAVENARLFQAEQQRREQLEAVRVVSAEIARELDLDRLLDLILRRAMELAGAEAGVIMLWDEAEQALFPRLRLGEFWAKMPVRPIPLGEGIVGHVAQTRQGLIINDYHAWVGARQLALAQTAITAALGEPLLYRDQLIGAISLVHTGGRRVFEAHHGALLRLFADQAAIAIQNAQLHAAAMRRGRELEALVVATRSVMSGLDLQEILDHILSEAAKIAGTTHVRVALVEREAQVLRVARVTGELVAPGFAYPLAGSLSGLVVTKGEPIYSANAASDPQSYFGPRYRELGIVTFLGLPIKSGGEVLGVLIFNTSTPRQYSAEELRYLTSFADQAAIALENARLYEGAQRELADRKRAEEMAATRTLQLEAIREVTTEVTRELDLSRLLELITCRAVELVGASSGILRLWEDEHQLLATRAWTGIPSQVPTVSLRLGEGISGELPASPGPLCQRLPHRAVREPRPTRGLDPHRRHGRPAPLPGAACRGAGDHAECDGPPVYRERAAGPQSLCSADRHCPRERPAVRGRPAGPCRSPARPDGAGPLREAPRARPDGRGDRP